MQIELRECDMERIQEICCDRAAAVASEAVTEDVIVAIREAVDGEVRRLTGEKVSEIIEQLMSAGFPKTDNYGNVIGSISLRQRVTDTLFPSNGYDSPVTRIFRESLDRELKGELAELLKQAKAKLKDMLEENILDKLREYLRDGMLLKK